MNSGLRVSYSILKDNYGGMGLFSKEDIKKGTLVWNFDEANISTWEFDYLKYLLKTFDKKTLKDVFTYNYFTEDSMIDMRFDDGRYINHSPDPNILSGYEINRQLGFKKYKDKQLLNSYAVKDIPKGVEILDDYNTYGTTPDWIQEIVKNLDIDNSYLE